MNSRYSIEQARPKLGQILQACVSQAQTITRNGVPAGMVVPPDAIAVRVHAEFNDVFPHAKDLEDFVIQLVDKPEDFDLVGLQKAIFLEITRVTPLGILYTGTKWIGTYYDPIEFDIEQIRDSLPVDLMWKLADQHMREEKDHDSDNDQPWLIDRL
jgi:hypothetical protein